VTPTPASESSYQDTDTYEFIGIVDNIGVSYWIINGIVYQINGNTEIDENLTIGERVSGIYKIEKDGSFVAIIIKMDLKYDYNETSETPEATESSENQSSATITPDEPSETEDGDSTPEHEKTPEPTEDHLDPN
jgi:hypothetical protein